ncbi:Myb-DNA-bind-3 domain-containing protein [Mycena chlorophos]|uniref:Myb-DNA-bind-3 domain-containing protein n=1 Tax=Mycena chlorophos TaxID=658473 RepID=A0A8H6VSJ3_MYCCL|nr:Myb-DNA-bind-3 domain-containing protein [Mycena chlorophos]
MPEPAPIVAAEAPAKTTGKGQKKPSTRVKWRDADDSVLVDVLVREKNEYQTDSGWKPQVWAIVAAALKDSPGAAKTAAKCQDHFGTVRSHVLSVESCLICLLQIKAKFNEVNELRKKSGFGWDDGLKMATASDETWKDFVEVKRNEWALKWQKATFPLFDDMLYLVEGIVATGENAFHAGSSTTTPLSGALAGTSHGHDDNDKSPGSPTTSHNPQTPARPSRGPIPAPQFNDANPSSPFTAPTSPRAGQKRAASSSPQKPSGGRQRRRNADAASEMAAALRDVAGALHVRGSPEIRARAVELLEEDGDFSDDDVAIAMELFEEKVSVAQTYIASRNKETRTKYLQRRLEKMNT